MAQMLSNGTKPIIMDTKLIKQYGEEILSYRLRSARQKRRMQYEDFDKQLLQLDKRRRELTKKKRNLGWEPLIPPVQKGWKRFFVLRDDVARGKQADFFQHILDRINTYDWSYRKDFMVKKRRFGRKKYVVKEQRVLEPLEYQFKKLCFTEREQQFFHIEYSMKKWSREPVKRYVFVEPWRFVLRVKPNIIENIRIKDPKLESEIQQLNNYVERMDLQKRIDKILCVRHKDPWVKWLDIKKYNEADPHKNKSLQQILNLTRDME